jgi:hypothetical protein
MPNSWHMSSHASIDAVKFWLVSDTRTLRAQETLSSSIGWRILMAFCKRFAQGPGSLLLESLRFHYAARSTMFSSIARCI